uniref:Secreted protein n=1 Tax=Anopheles darlingi TaxID=43151 RepID=A0A2M4DBF2_ANODA
MLLLLLLLLPVPLPMALLHRQLRPATVAIMVMLVVIRSSTDHHRPTGCPIVSTVIRMRSASIRRSVAEKPSTCSRSSKSSRRSWCVWPSRKRNGWPRGRPNLRSHRSTSLPRRRLPAAKCLVSMIRLHRACRNHRPHPVPTLGWVVILSAKMIHWHRSSLDWPVMDWRPRISRKHRRLHRNERKDRAVRKPGREDARTWPRNRRTDRVRAAAAA